MIKEFEFWESISDEVREYLSMKYYQKTRCCIDATESARIARKELQSIHNEIAINQTDFVDDDNECDATESDIY